MITNTKNEMNDMDIHIIIRNLTMDINVKGVWYGCKHAIIAMRNSGGGSVINTASFVALRGAATPQLACK